MYKNIKYICKRNGEYEDYDISKLQESLIHVLKKENEYKESDQFIQMTAKKISFLVSDKLNDSIYSKVDYVSTNNLCNCVCDELFGIGYSQTAKSYIVNRYENLLSEKDKLISCLKSEILTYTQGDKE